MKRLLVLALLVLWGSTSHAFFSEVFDSTNFMLQTLKKMDDKLFQTDALAKAAEQLRTMGEELAVAREALETTNEIYDTGVKMYDVQQKIRDYMGDPTKLMSLLNNQFIGSDFISFSNGMAKKAMSGSFDLTDFYTYKKTLDESIYVSSKLEKAWDRHKALDNEGKAVSAISNKLEDINHLWERTQQLDGIQSRLKSPKNQTDLNLAQAEISMIQARNEADYQRAMTAHMRYQSKVAEETAKFYKDDDEALQFRMEQNKKNAENLEKYESTEAQESFDEFIKGATDEYGD